MGQIKRVKEADINLEEFFVFKEKCQKTIAAGSIDYHTAMALGLEACAMMNNLIQPKAWLTYTASELEREAKLKFSQLLNVTAGTSADKREAMVRVDPGYQTIISELSEITALLGLVNDAFSTADKYHYFFRTIYTVENKMPNPNGVA